MAAAPLRLWASITVIAVGVATVITISNLSVAGEQRIQGDLDQLAPREIRILPGNGAPYQFDRARAALMDLEGIVGAVGLERLPDLLEVERILGQGVLVPLGRLSITGVTLGLEEAAAGQIVGGRGFNQTDIASQALVAVIGDEAARLAQIDPSTLPVRLVVGEASFEVIGVLRAAGGGADLDSSFFVPYTTLRETFSATDTEAWILVRTLSYPTRTLLGLIPLVVDPHEPGRVVTSVAPYPELTRSLISHNLNVLVSVVGFSIAALGFLLVAIIGTEGVLRRRAEIGMRRALGATRFSIALTVIVESCAVGAIAASFGAATGGLLSGAVAAYLDWPPFLRPTAVVDWAVLGIALGALAGGLPAIRSSMIAPIDALRLSRGI